MEYHIDLSSFIVEAENESEAYQKAVEMLEEDPSLGEICEVSPV